jgi:hypothetical protein
VSSSFAGTADKLRGEASKDAARASELKVGELARDYTIFSRTNIILTGKHKNNQNKAHIVNLQHVNHNFLLH